MPIYEYQCAVCAHMLEKLQKISDSKLTTCPECGKDELQKIISSSGFRLGGTGWYETDFKTGQKKNIKETTDATNTSKSTPDSVKSDGAIRQGEQA